MFLWNEKNSSNDHQNPCVPFTLPSVFLSPLIQFALEVQNSLCRLMLKLLNHHHACPHCAASLHTMNHTPVKLQQQIQTKISGL